MTRNRSRGVSRRSLLTGIGASLVAAPFLGGLLNRVARAAEGESELRFFLMFTGNGQHPDHWLPPSGGEGNFTLSPVLQSLAPQRNKLLLMHGLVGECCHPGGMSEALTGWPDRTGQGVAENGPSIDQFLAERWRGSTFLPSLELGILPANEANDQICYSASGLPVPAVGSPRGAFDRVFGDGSTDADLVTARRGQRASVLDVVASDLEKINSQLGREERVLLDEHLTLVRAKELDLLKPFEPLSCEQPIAPGGQMGLIDGWKAQNDNIVAAFRCGLTRVATLRAGGWGGIEESGAYGEIGISDGHHSIAHAGPNSSLLTINEFHAQQFAYVIGQLDAVSEGNGTLLDNTVAIWINELGLGELNHHSRSDVHVVMAGGAAAGMRNGSYVDLGGVDYQDFLFSLTHLMGFTETTRFGDHGTNLISPMFI